MIEKMRHIRKSLLLVSKMLILAAMVLVFYVVYRFQYSEFSGTQFWAKGYYLMVLLYGVILLVFCTLYGATRIGVFRLNEIIYSFGLSILFSNGLIYIQLSLMERKLLPLQPMLLIIVLQMLISVTGAYLVNKLYFLLYPARETVVVLSESRPSISILQKLQAKKERYQVKAVISEMAPIEDIYAAMDKYGAVLLCDIDPKLRQQLFSYGCLTGKRIYLLPGVQDVMTKNAHSTQLFDTPLYYCKNSGMSTEQAFMKRVVDMIISLIGVVAALPFMVAVAVAIKIEDRGPVFFNQKRLTLDGKTFYVHKFRSMVIDAEKDGARLAAQNDDRITKVGKIIRATRLDELPQLLNILKGEMSVVGPRPERPEIAEEYEREMPEFRLRLGVKAGLTGFAQIYGKYNTTPRDKLLLDLMYIANYSLLLDFKLMLMTIKILFMKESTEGVDSSQVLPTDPVKKAEDKNDEQTNSR